MWEITPNEFATNKRVPHHLALSEITIQKSTIGKTALLKDNIFETTDRTLL